MKGFFKRIVATDRGSLEVIRRLLIEQGAPFWKQYALSFLLMGIAAASTAGTAYLLGKVINKSYVDRDFPAIVVLSGVTAGLFIAKAIATYLSTIVLSRVGNAVIANNQRRLFAKLMQERLSFFSNKHSSEFTARLTSGANAVNQVLNLCTNAVGRDLLLLVSLAAVMIWQDPFLSLFGLAIAPPAMLTIRKIIKRIKEIVQSQFTGAALTLETLQETLQGMRTVKAFALEDAMRQRMSVSIDSVEKMSNKLARVSNRSSPLMEMLGGLSIAACLVYGGYRVIETGSEPGQFFSFLTAFLLAYEPAKRLARLNVELTSAVIGARLLLDIVDSPPSEPNDDAQPAIKASLGKIEFQKVTFSYRPETEVLQGLSFVAEPGKMTALVGPSGGGKSTVLSLILRLYEPSGGKILVDGQDVTGASRRSLREAIAYVGQDVYLFRDTIRANILLGKQGASDAEVVAAATAAYAHEFIMSFPLGYDTPVGEHGAQLSGGQRQRIAVARAFIRDAQIILLDEATASLDSESEQLVQDAIDRLRQNRTTLVIAHHLRTIMHADEIVVIEGGRAVETGRHADLLRRGGRYASFFNLQHKTEKSPATVD